MKQQHVSYFTRKMSLDMRERLHAMVRQKRRQGHLYTVEDVVNSALEIGVTLMELGEKRRVK